MARPPSDAIIDIRRCKFERAIADQLVDGLSKDPKTLPALLFYSTEGIQHWNRHSHAADFYPRRDEMEILRREAHSIAESIANHSAVIDLGSASLDKVLLLLDALEAQKKEITYYALDLSRPELVSTLEAIPRGRFHHVQIAALHGTFEDGLDWVRNSPETKARPHCILLLGLTLGNFSRSNAAAFLRSIAHNTLAGCGPSSSIIVTLDSCKSPTKILRAYTAEGVCPFALAALPYANSLLGPDDDDKPVFDVRDWDFHSEWNFQMGRHEASLITRDKDVQLGGPLKGIVVSRKEKVRFGCSYKYTLQERNELLEAAGLYESARWTADGCDVAFYQLGLIVR
ncbi:4-dimethylallyltryptophan N-methyltransferase [Aspergillus unguis]